LGRFDFSSANIEYQSESTVVIFADDVISNTEVCLKVMNDEKAFQREVQGRNRLQAKETVRRMGSVLALLYGMIFRVWKIPATF